MMPNSESQKVVPSRSSAGRGGARRPSSNTVVAKDFQDVYLQSCALKGVHPSRMVTLFLEDNILDIHAEKLDSSDWRTVIEALKIARHNLRFIAIRSSQKNTLPIRPQTKDVAPCRLTLGNILCHVATALGCTLATTNHLTCLELQNIPLTLQDLDSLNNGLSRNNTLQHLSLQQCPIGDAGVEVICKVLKNCLNVTSLNVSQCLLSWKSAETLALLVKHQTVYRHCDTWKETLRDEIAILDHMGGMQRITLNGNPRFGDRGAQILAEVLHDDLWLKALDMQECGVQDQGASALLSALKHNTTLFILDLRLNFVKDCNLRLRISQQLSFNVQGQTSQFKWFKLPVDTERSNKKRGRCGQSIRKRGIPWRVAARLGSIRHYPIGHVPGIANVFLHSKPTLLSGLSSEDRTEAGSIRSSLADNGRAPRLPLKMSNQRCRRSLPNSGHTREILDVIRTEITEVRELLRKEKEARLEAEKRATKLTTENEMLRQQLANCDETTLATIETTFGKFNDFLKALHQMGYGHIIDGYKDPAAANVPFGDTQLSTKDTILNRIPQETTNRANTSRVQQEKRLLKSNGGNGNPNLDNSHPSKMSVNTGKSVNGSGAQKSSRTHVNEPQLPVRVAQKNTQRLNENQELNNFSISSAHNKNDSSRNEQNLSFNFSRMSMSSPVESLDDVTLSEVRF